MSAVVIDVIEKGTVARNFLKQMGIEVFFDRDLTDVAINRPGQIWTQGAQGWERHIAPAESATRCARIWITRVPAARCSEVPSSAYCAATVVRRRRWRPFLGVLPWGSDRTVRPRISVAWHGRRPGAPPAPSKEQSPREGKQKIQKGSPAARNLIHWLKRFLAD